MIHDLSINFIYKRKIFLRKKFFSHFGEVLPGSTLSETNFTKK